MAADPDRRSPRTGSAPTDPVRDAVDPVTGVSTAPVTSGLIARRRGGAARAVLIALAMVLTLLVIAWLLGAFG